MAAFTASQRRARASFSLSTPAGSTPPEGAAAGASCGPGSSASGTPARTESKKLQGFRLEFPLRPLLTTT